ncbi:MAG: hypothetical protein AAF282_21710, partial [Cyanobacteria bacterium P01_A01_bin.15]
MVKAVWQRLRTSVGWCKAQLPEFSTSIRQKSNTSIRQSTRSANQSTGLYVISRHTPLNQTQIAILLTVLLLTAILGQRFYNQPALSVDSIAAETFVAPYNATLPDMITTEENRQAARSGSIIVLQIDQEKTKAIKEEADGILAQASVLRQRAGSVPYLSTAQLSSVTQRYLRQAPLEDWEALWELAQQPELTASALQQGTSSSLQTRINNLGADQRTALEELVRLRERSSQQAMLAIRSQVNANRQQYTMVKPELKSLTTREGVPPLDHRLLDLSDADWQTIQSASRLVLNRMLIQGIHEGMPPELWQKAVSSQLQNTLNLGAPGSLNRDDLIEQETIAEEMVAKIVSSVLQPNLVEDLEQTRLRAEQVENEVKTVTVSIEQGDAIVRKGETITQGDFVLLDHFNL